MACRQTGFTYLWVLVAVAIVGVGLAAAAEVWSTAAERQRVAQADWAGAQYVQAIAGYYEYTPGLVKAYPATLDELLEDRRGGTVRRHLRARYDNPLTADRQWQLVRGGDARIRGVRLLFRGANGLMERVYVHVPTLAG